MNFLDKGVTLAELQHMPLDNSDVAWRDGWRDGWGEALKAVERAIEERRATFHQAIDLGWEYWIGDLAVWARDTSHGYIEMPRSPLDTAPKRATGTTRLRFRVLQRDGFRCQLCGATAQEGSRLEVDHRVPKSKGGPTVMSNLWTLCHDCNAGKSDLDLEAR